MSRAARRAELIQQIGVEIVRFQDGANEVDSAAAEVLGLELADLRTISLLLYAAVPARELSLRLGLSPRAAAEQMRRLEMAGYARTEGQSLSLTAHARQWVETIWGPLQAEGVRLLEQESTQTLAILARFMAAIGPVQERHAARLRALAQTRPSGRRLRGGLSPAAAKRVQLFVEANLARPLPLAELARRAGLSAFHFARAFKQTMGVTPRAFIERRRVERVKVLLESSSMPLAEIALVSGLGSQSRMTTVFHKATGATPAAWRRSARPG